MQSIKGTILIVMLICGVIVCPCLGRAGRSVSGKRHPTAMELLGKYAETQEKLQSFRLKSKTMQSSSLKIKNPTRPFKQGKTTHYYETEFRSDGYRTSFRDTIWGDIGSTGEFKTRDQSNYFSTLWQGKSFIKYTGCSVYHTDCSTDERIIIIHNDKEDAEREGSRPISRGHGHSLMGYFYGDDERVDSILRQAASISVRTENEKVNGIDCFVIDARTLERGRYTLWIDPEHGYNIARAEQRRDGKNQHKFYVHPMMESGKISSSLENVRFQKIDNVWVPMEADISTDRIFGQGKDFHRSKTHHERYEFVLNPDHEALNSFVPDDIPNGSKAYIVGVRSRKYTWQDGKIVDEKGREVDYKAKAKENKADKSGSDANDLSEVETETQSESSGISASQLLAKYRATRDILRTYSGASQLLAKYRATRDILRTYSAEGQRLIEENSRKEKTTSELGFDAARAGYRVHFPTDRSLGMLHIQDAGTVRQIKTFHHRNDGTTWEYFGEAQGDVTVPAGKRLALFVNRAAWRDLSPLSELRPDDLYKLRLPGGISQIVKPDDRCMPHIAGLTSLKVLGLVGTNISSKGLRYIKDFKKLERLHLPFGITDAGLADIAELHSLKGLYFQGRNQVTNAGLR
ncbi:MAG: hypothetical protein ACYTBP_17810, partial [Planctomycetota bacterium]